MPQLNTAITFIYLIYGAAYASFSICIFFFFPWRWLFCRRSWTYSL